MEQLRSEPKKISRQARRHAERQIQKRRSGVLQSAPPAEAMDAEQWATERQWLIDFARRGLLVTTEAEKSRMVTAVRRLTAEIGDDPARITVHEAGHAVVAYALGWYVEWVTPELPDNRGGGAMVHQLRPEYSPLATERERFLEQLMVGVAGYVAEEMTFGLAFPFEVADLRDRAWEEHGIGDDVFPDLVVEAEERVRAILTERGQTVQQLAAAQVALGRVEGDALAAIIGPPAF